MGRAAMRLFPDGVRCLSSGDGVMPAGEAVELGTIKSSRFIGSACDSIFEWSTDFRSWAMPLGAVAEAGAYVGPGAFWSSCLYSKNN